MEEQVSKSQKKREAEALQKIGSRLVALSSEVLDKIPLTAPLRQAIEDAKTIKSHGATRRQAQLIGKLMRAANHEAITASYEEILSADSAQTAAFHELEIWRDRLISGNKETLTEFVQAHPTVDVQQLRQLIKKAAEDKTSEKNSGAARALFRFLKGKL